MSKIASNALNATLTFAAVVSVFILCFSSELGYTIYNSYDAGFYIAMLAPVIPIMYLDHVTDQVLKGLGEQVYSMWVNITDSLLSVALVWFLIPKLGISAYALVIIIMEGYNFLFSYFRLRKKIQFKISLIKSFFLPIATALVASLLSNRLFAFSGKDTSLLWLIVKMIFVLCVYFFINAFLCVIGKKTKGVIYREKTLEDQ